MKIKLGTIKKDVTAFGNKYWIQIEDTAESDNSDLEFQVGCLATVIIGFNELEKEEDSILKGAQRGEG